jgi:hypothetical protein
MSIDIEISCGAPRIDAHYGMFSIDGVDDLPILD